MFNRQWCSEVLCKLNDLVILRLYNFHRPSMRQVIVYTRKVTWNQILLVIYPFYVWLKTLISDT